MSRAHGDTAATRTMAAASSGGTPVPRNVWRECGEFLPHACAPVITILRERRTGRRIVRIQDRRPARHDPELEKEAADMWPDDMRRARWHTRQPRQQAEAEPGRCGQ
jgi:hypothetical protein